MKTSEAWQIMGLPTSATPQTIERTYKKLARQAHPDCLSGSAEKWHKLCAAYRICAGLEKGEEAASRVVLAGADADRVKPSMVAAAARGYGTGLQTASRAVADLGKAWAAGEDAAAVAALDGVEAGMDTAIAGISKLRGFIDKVKKGQW